MIKKIMKTPITYYGGKQTLLPYILPLIPKHSIYTEAFCGGAAVFFAKEKAKLEVINDINLDLVNFYVCLQNKYDELNNEINKTLHSRAMHSNAIHIIKHKEFYTDIQRAWAIWVMSKMSFASRLFGSFAYDFDGTTTKKIVNAKKNFTKELSERLEGATIECIDALEIIKKYDKDDAFHFVDPPYIGTNCGHYEGTFSEYDLLRLLDLLSKIKGKFMLTMFPSKMIEDFMLKHNWRINKVERTISASKTNRRKQEEWIVCNY